VAGNGVGIRKAGDFVKRSKTKHPEKPLSGSEHEPYKIRLPGFIVEQEVGLGDVVKRATYALGVKPCGGCENRAATLNQWVVFSR
jgi:hypothetical protein